VHADAQAEATALAQPQLEGADIDCNFKGVDVLPIASALERGSAAQAQRLKLNGRTKFSVRLTDMSGPELGVLLASSLADAVLLYHSEAAPSPFPCLVRALPDESPHAHYSADSCHSTCNACFCLCSGLLGDAYGSVAEPSKGDGQQEQQRRSAFAGDLTLDGLRVNQLKLSRNLTGTVLLSDDRFEIKAKVRRRPTTLSGHAAGHATCACCMQSGRVSRLVQPPVQSSFFEDKSSAQEI
jgi:hypothetical protein